MREALCRIRSSVSRVATLPTPDNRPERARPLDPSRLPLSAAGSFLETVVSCLPPPQKTSKDSSNAAPGFSRSSSHLQPSTYGVNKHLVHVYIFTLSTTLTTYVLLSPPQSSELHHAPLSTTLLVGCWPRLAWALVVAFQIWILTVNHEPPPNLLTNGLTTSTVDDAPPF